MKLGGETIQHHLFRLKFTELNEIYTVMTMRSFILGLIGIFVPIYLWKLGFTLGSILLVYAGIYFVQAILQPPMAFLIARLGPKHLIALSMPLLILNYIVLWTMPTYHWPLWLVSLTEGIALVFFWQAYHWDLSRAKSCNHATSELTSVYLLSSIAGACAPFIGGFISTQYGINYVFGIVAFLLVFTIFPLFATSEPHVTKKIDFNKLNGKKIQKQVLSFMGLCAHGAVGQVVWPILVYLIIKTYQGVGLVSSLSMIATFAATYFIGKAADSGRRIKFIKLGSYLLSITWFLKTLTSTFFHIFSLDFLNNLANSLFYSSFVSEYYLHADEESRTEYIVVMEVAADISRFVVFMLLYFLTLYFSVQTVLMVGLILAGFSSLLIGLMPPSKRDVKIENQTIKLMPRPVRVK